MKNFTKRTRVCMMVSAGIMVLAIILSVCGLGINFGIDFAGGMNATYNMHAAFEQSDIEAALASQGIKEFTITQQGAAKEELSLRIKESNVTSEEGIQDLRTALEADLLVKYPDMDVAGATWSYVGPVAGATLIKNAFVSVLLAAALMLIYIAIRFDLPSGIAAVIGLLHEVLIMLSFMVLLRSVIQMNSSYIAAMLTIVGYSINNTIVIFDRIRENNRRAGQLTREQVVDKSVKECLGRTINTTLTTLITIVALYVMGVDSIREFALPIIIGILAGAYSANLINGYVWAVLEDKLKARKALKAKRA